VVFERDGCGPIASAVIGQDENALGLWVLFCTVEFPPFRDGICGKGGRVVTDADTYHSLIGYRVVNAVRADFRFCIGREVMIGNGSIAVAPHSSGIFEVADEFLFLGVNADGRLAPTGEAFSGGADMAELEISLSALLL